MNFIVKSTAKDLLKQISKEWKQRETLKEIKQALADHRNYMNSLSHSEYQDFKRHQREHINRN
tara:strand:+ start:391 stop:579 length:189 start_codon:yes stop_codon:yes gene_type:complete